MPLWLELGRLAAGWYAPVLMRAVGKTVRSVSHLRSSLRETRSAEVGEPVARRAEHSKASTRQRAARSHTTGRDLYSEDAPATTEADYRRQIARYRRGGLLGLVAAAATEFSGPRNVRGYLAPEALNYRPWALADVARVSLAASARGPRERATPHDLSYILAMYNNLDEPLRAEGGGLEQVEAFMLRVAGEQFSWQEQDYQAAARSAAVLLHTPFPPDTMPRCITPGWEHKMLGCSLAEYVSTARILWASALANQGRFNLAYIDGPNVDPEWKTIDPAMVRRTLDTHFAIAVTDFPKADRKHAAAAAYDRRLRRFTFNPLRARPAVTGLGPDYLCPIPQLAWAKTTLAGLYFTGLERLGNRFPEELGHLFEQYVGRQLRLIPGATVIPEIVYTGGSTRDRGVDWIIVFDDLVLLVEVKSAAPTEENRLGGPEAWKAAAEKIGKGFTQIEGTAAKIKDRHPAFAAIPDDRRVLGLVVTREPFPTANWPDVHRLFPAISIQTSITGIAELERIVTMTDTTVDRFLCEIADDPQRRHYDLVTSLPRHTFGSNPVLDQGWRSLPWRYSDEQERIARELERRRVAG